MRQIIRQRGTGPRATSCRNTATSSRNARATSSESAGWEGNRATAAAVAVDTGGAGKSASPSPGLESGRAAACSAIRRARAAWRNFRWFYVGAALQPDHLQTGLREFAGHDAAGPAHADHDCIDFLQSRCHGRPLREVRYRLRFRVVSSVSVWLDHVGVGGRQSRETDHLPRYLVAVAAVIPPKALVVVDVAELAHKPMPAWEPRRYTIADLERARDRVSRGYPAQRRPTTGERKRPRLLSGRQDAGGL
jgi:hypothetical protein